MLIDFAHIDKAFARSVHAKIDHRYLNDVRGLSNPTAENISRWAFARLNTDDVFATPGAPTLHSVQVFETCRGGAIFTRSNE